MIVTIRLRRCEPNDLMLDKQSKARRTSVESKSKHSCNHRLSEGIRSYRVNQKVFVFRDKLGDLTRLQGVMADLQA